MSNILDAFKSNVRKKEDTNVNSNVIEQKSTTSVETTNTLPINIVEQDEPSNITPDQKEASVNPTDVVEVEVNTEDVEEGLPINLLPLETEKKVVREELEKLQVKPQDEKKAELDFYKFYAYKCDLEINALILKYGDDTNGLLDALEARILMLQQNQVKIRTYEQHTRLRRSLVISERNAKDLEKKRKSDLTYRPFVPGESIEKVKKAVKRTVKSGSSQKEKLIEDLISKGLTREQAIALIG